MNFERTPLELQRAIKSKRERERVRERRKEGRSPGQPVGKEKIKGNLIFWGRSFGRP